MVNRKAFLLKTCEGKHFIVVFAENDGVVLSKAYGYAAFPNKDFIPVYSVNQALDWLRSQGHIYVKRLPFIMNEPYTPNWERRVLKWLEVARSA